MLLVFIMKWALALTLLYSLYGLFLSKETFYTVNRCMLLSIIVISAVLPFVHITTEHQSIVNETIESISQEITLQQQTTQNTDSGSTYTALVILCIYVLGVMLVACRYVLSMLSVYKIIRRSKKKNDYYINDKVESPFSWFNYIVISRSDLNKNGMAMLVHERVHVHRGHSYDLLFCDISCCLQWFNPFMWMLKEDLCAVHEYEADYGVIRCEWIDYHDYQMLLIDKATERQMPTVVNSINRSSLKHRLKQMYRKPSSKRAMLKVIYIIPLSMFVMYAFASPEITHELNTFAAKAEESLVEAEREVVKTITDETNSKEDAISTEVVDPSEDAEPSPSNDVIINPDTPPVFENGLEDFYEYLYTYRHYPRIALDNDVKGLVVVYFVVETDGSVSEIEIESSEATSDNPQVTSETLEQCKDAFEEETKRMVETMPKWQPGSHDGNVVRCAFSKVIRF